MGFNLVNLAISVFSEDAARLKTYLALSGKEYAAACRNFSCRWPERECASCSMKDTCRWHLVFGQVLTSDPTALKRHQKPPLPFVFSFPDTTEKATTLVIGLVVIGRAITCLEMLLDGFNDLISSGSSPVAAEVRHIACRDYQDVFQQRDVVSNNLQSGNWIPENLVITSTEGLLDSRLWLGSTLRIQLQSPLRLIESGHAAVDFNFGLFARSVMRRVSALVYYYGESELCHDFKMLSRQVDEILCAEDHFRYMKTENRKLSGIRGYGCFRGDFSHVMPFLIIGSYVHTGKCASFGMGCYELHPDDEC